jgi:putative hydrolase of the HAD superfamily
MMRSPQVIFLDAVGTLFGVQGSVGGIYAQVADSFGVEVTAERLDRAFPACFQAAPPLAFPSEPSDRIAELEFAWWYAIARATFEQTGDLEKFADFEAFFAVLYAHFATIEPWFLYGDVVPTLQRWRERGIELGIISNFDSRIYPVLKSLEIDSFFQTITISSTAGAAKPNPRIFQTALEKHDCPPENAWHIGDSRKEDYHGARAIGIRSFWIQR